MSNHAIVYIYVLIDPRDNQIRYVGQTIDPDKRYGEHLRDKTPSYRGRWVRSLLANGVQPEMKVIEEATLANWVERERFWIAWHREQGARLVNTTDGGEGTPGRLWSEEWKQEQRRRMNEPDLRKRMSLNKGKLTEQQVQAIVSESTSGGDDHLIAQRYNTTYAMVRAILTGRAYSILTKIQYQKKKGSSSHGGGRLLLNDDQVRMIIQRLWNGDKQEDIAKDVGVSEATIWAIAHGRAYTHIPRPNANLPRNTGNEKLTSDQVRLIAYEYMQVKKYGPVARKFDVFSSTVRDIVTKKSYKHVNIDDILSGGVPF